MLLSDRMKGMFEGRPVWGLVGGYVIAAWIVLQVTETLASLVGLPLWFGKAVLGLLAAGLVLVVVTGLIQRRLEAANASPERRRLRRVFTWRNAAGAGIAGFALLGLGTAGYMATRALGVGPAGSLMARGLLSENELLVLADFEDNVRDPGLADAITQAFRVHLSQSPTLTLASDAQVAEVLTRMQFESVQPFDADAAREVAIREGLKAVVAGELYAIGTQHTVAARVLTAESGEEIGSWLESADSQEQLIAAVDRLSTRLRERIGEPLLSVRRSEPLSKVRTASLGALRNYTEASVANSRGDFERCALLTEDAIELDSMFAMAYVARAACNQNLARDRALQISDQIRAYVLRERMLEEERLRLNRDLSSIRNRGQATGGRGVGGVRRTLPGSAVRDFLARKPVRRGPRLAACGRHAAARPRVERLEPRRDDQSGWLSSQPGSYGRSGRGLG